ncbi:sulfurtransferase [Sphingomonas sp.]|uniref:sulfurtransferase n=1 Tax=Sphingomonas sp. TaxID=28214 RepID=UPI003CC68692
MDDLVSTDWLAAQPHAADLRVVDATYVDAATGRDPAAEYAAAHIPGAVFLDLGELRNIADPRPMMMPSRMKFAGRMQALGIGDRDRIVLYDDSPWRTSARAWFMLRQFGARSVALLDGGLAKWKAEGRLLVGGDERPRRAKFDGRTEPEDVRTLDEVQQALRLADAQLLDARSAARFTGDEPDPRPGVAPGHMPGAKNLPSGDLFNPDGTWKTGDALAQAFAAAGVDLNRRIITTCGSGITAAVLSFGLHLLGRDSALYDGSWSEWGASPATAKAMGEV